MMTDEKKTGKKGEKKKPGQKILEMREKYVERSRARKKINGMKQKENNNRMKILYKRQNKKVYFMSLLEICIKKVQR